MEGQHRRRIKEWVTQAMMMAIATAVVMVRHDKSNDKFALHVLYVLRLRYISFTLTIYGRIENTNDKTSSFSCYNRCGLICLYTDTSIYCRGGSGDGGSSSSSSRLLLPYLIISRIPYLILSRLMLPCLTLHSPCARRIGLYYARHAPVIDTVNGR